LFLQKQQIDCVHMEVCVSVSQCVSVRVFLYMRMGTCVYAMTSV
jgi:hypothetical protein